MSLTRHDLLALLIVVGAAAASLVVWGYGRVNIGMTLVAEQGQVRVADVTPDGNAARAGFSPTMPLLDLTTVDGGDVLRGEPLGKPLNGVEMEQYALWDYLGPMGAPLTVIDADHRPPAEAIEPARIATAVAAYYLRDVGEIDFLAQVDRSSMEYWLRESIWLVVLGATIGIGLWWILGHGVGGTFGRDHAILLGAASATPFLLAPLIQVGHPGGIFAGYLVPAAMLLLVGVVLTRGHRERAWAQTARAAALLAAGLAVTLVVRYMTSPALSSGDRGGILALVAAAAVVPAMMAATTVPRRRDRWAQLSLSLLPAAALSLHLPSSPSPELPLVLMAGLVGWQLLPAQAWAVIGGRLHGMRPEGLRLADADPAMSSLRDRLLLGLIAIVAAFGVVQMNSWAAIVGVGLAAAVGFSIRQGFLGPDWTDAAVPLAAATGFPLMLHAFAAWDYGGAMGWATVPQSLAALGVAHLLAERHTERAWRSRLLAASAIVAAVSIFLGAQQLPLALVLAAAIPLIPGLPAAFAVEPGEVRALTTRLETMAVALTPAAAATALIPGTNGVLLGAWLLAVIVWRRFAFAPLLGMAQRTQLQRDLAVAAAETERARLAADLHDDALQQLTMLVRTLDEAGQADAAAEAREVATKLRSVVGDLRLPILDDLGAGAALEWLVERVEPLAGGPVRLERSDATRPPANIELAVFRVAQEALTNAIKHGSPPIAVHYDVRADGRVTLAIDDAGPGIGAEQVSEAPGKGHFGLANMQQRAEQIGALLDVRRWPAGGTRVALEWRPG